ncbi:tryptophan synthase subunit beta [Streptococcus suis]|uniref:AbiH family protein n=1 Tax=Streptococcus parasuis TaxID=1501662 RepID=UPI001EF8947A|nr:AbiH family protein [Streptococcus parasuis]MDG4524781.1 bacteriophage abortive infection AbiH family protein [Streptococcus suis]ULL20217.1 tryptophan synthase subunit beta [Streptococcus suis]WFB92034.1 bacteriophage abortive infection AbiH family protein [Streptococcus parasuis]
MYITYIVGNGLDIQYGLKTKYKNFYEFQNEIYKNKKEKNDYSNFIYEALFKDRVNDYENWSDFELSIGKLTRDNEEITKTNDAKEKFINDLSDVIDDLRFYLSDVQKSFEYEQKIIDFGETFNRLISDLPTLNQPLITKLFDENRFEHDIVNLMTLNYTNVLDKLFEKSMDTYKNNYRSSSSSTYKFIVRKPIHCHGSLELNTILGVSNSEQLSDEFSEEQREFLIKNLSLSGVRENLDIRNEQIIKNSDILIIYGASLGQTDSYLWEKVAKCSLERGVPIIIYHYVENFDAGNPIRVRRLYTTFEDRFVNNCGIDSELEQQLRKNIITVIGKSIFKLVDIE